MYIIANWKSNKTLKQAQEWVAQFGQDALALSSGGAIGIAAPFVFLPFLSSSKETLLQRKVLIGAQDISPFGAGSYTGAVSARNLEGLFIDFVLVGHSERREYFGETDSGSAQKITQALAANILPILCVSDENKDSQLSLLSQQQLEKTVVAYEPLAAIGTGKPASPESVSAITAELKQKYNPKAVLYGGSVSSNNVAQYTKSCDGFLVGGASLDAKEFSQLILAATL